jgi:dynein regulatory complex protein 1
VKDLKKMAEDIDLMIERMDEQVKQLTKAYRDELTQIEKSFVAERTELLESQRRKWDSGMEGRRDKEKDSMVAREQRVEDFDKQLQHLRTQDAEEYNMVKIKLETNVQILEQQLQQMRATYQLNQEKLDYNFQVLRKRDEENTITKSQQKRKITRLQDVLTNLKVKLAKQEKCYREENQQLTEDYKRIQEQFRELQKKSKHFMATDVCKFRDVWIMNEEEAKALVQKVMEEDRIIHEQQLGLAWEPPNLDFMENIGPILSQRAKRRTVSAQQVVSEVMSATGQAPTEQEEKDDSAPAGGKQNLRTSLLDKLSPSTVKSILELLCDESGFLIESKLQKLLTPLERDEQSLMKLDAIFSALGIETEDDIHCLSGYFLALQEEAEKTAPSTQTGQESTQETADESVETPAAGNVPKKLIHPNEVMKALRMFVEDNKQPVKDKGRGAQFQLAGLEERDDSDDAAYWAGYPNVLSEHKGKLWDALLDGLEKYSEVLGSRAGLITETEGLRQQNAELRMLLHQYINSKVNQELEIPPTKVLQLDGGAH